jgi:signal recognition particle subunit SRP54
MFENLSDKLQNALKKLRGKGKLTEKDIDLAMKEIKMSLLEADVNYKVVKDFIKTVKERSLGTEVMESLTPGQQVVKIVHEELTEIMGQGESRLKFNSNGITYFMMCGLQGAGKTTACGKLAKKLKKEGRRPLLAACDVYRPAAIKQLMVVGESVGVPVFQMGDKISPVKIAKEAMNHAMKQGNDVVIIDTAGRLHIDDDLMDELVEIKETLKPHEILLLLDAMTGQDAVKVAETFNSYLDITGVILTKVDGDARGGAALSIRRVVDKPIKFLSVGEKMDQLETFHPDRMASRILGMGDVLSIIEVLDAADEYMKWISDLQGYALDQAVNNGKKWPGYKLVEGRSYRRYKDQGKVAEALIAAGYKEDEIYEKVLLGITKMERAVGRKEFNELLAGLIEKPPGKAKLAPESDKRPAVKSTAEIGFKEEL